MFYEISRYPNYVDMSDYSYTNPLDLVVSNRYEEGSNQLGFSTGHVNNNQYSLTVEDGEKPF